MQTQTQPRRLESVEDLRKNIGRAVMYNGRLALLTGGKKDNNFSLSYRYGLKGRTSSIFTDTYELKEIRIDGGEIATDVKMQPSVVSEGSEKYDALNSELAEAGI